MQAVLQFMVDLAEQEAAREKESSKRPGLGSRLLSLFRKRKSSSSPYVVRSVNPLNIRA